MKATIHIVSNGAWTRFDHEPTEAPHSPESVQDVVYEFADDDLGGDQPTRGMGGPSRLLWELVEWMGWGGSRYSRERIRIVIAHGDKYECRDVACKICGKGEGE